MADKYVLELTPAEMARLKRALQIRALQLETKSHDEAETSVSDAQLHYAMSEHYNTLYYKLCDIEIKQSEVSANG